MLQSGESAQNILEFASLLAIPVQRPPFCCFAGALYDYPQTDPALTAGMLLYGDFGPLSVSQVIFSKNGPFPMVGSLLVRDAPPPPITVTVDLEPETLNVASKGKFVTVYVEPPAGIPASAIDTSTVMMTAVNGQSLASAIMAEGPTSLGDSNANGIQDLSVRARGV